MATVASGFPTKEFFVGMLTRDIELSDAILDLLDNCLDGVVRQKRTAKRNDLNYYRGFFSHITICKDSFVIEDNCGGIPREVAEKYAFRMGRASDKIDDDLPTVGIYGIGMKRAIFKIGKSATVTTRNDNTLYQVDIPLDWASSEDQWDFPIIELTNGEVLSAGGTEIRISNLNPSIADNWNTPDKLEEFVNDLIKAIQQSYSFILQKGFQIEINGQSVDPLPIQLLVSETNTSPAIQPYLYKQTFDDVEVSLAVGFYAPPPSPDDIDDENKLKRSSSDAGWTIVCNDRVILYNDKSHLTGWGEAGVPQYHTQFIGIRGIVIFESNNPQHLPMTTTKRGIDTSSNIYSVVKDRMRHGLRLFTDYTNRWKGRNDSERKFSTVAKSVSVDTLIASKESIEASTPLKFRANKGGFVFNPTLPKPESDKPYKTISFSKTINEICDIVEFFYGDRDHIISASQVGEKCFDAILETAHRKKEGE